MDKSLYNVSEHRLDVLKNNGFDYKGQIFNRTLSPYLFNEAKRGNIILQFEKTFQFLIDSTKNIKKQFNFTLSKHETRYN